ncbi:hypothetical protein [Actinoplanes sp. G11-F43]|uniref:hypothetical protein n=1 Tax=Actinoplanes sp. G11-F43 TaxID=3424130 RepID=UPI003D348D9C
MAEPSTATSGDEKTDPDWITRWLRPGDLFRDEPLTDEQAGIELFDGSIYVDNRAGLAALGHAIVQHCDGPDTGTVAAAGLDPTADAGHTWPDVARAALAKPAVVYVATTDTRHYSWTGIGATAEQARDALMSAWYAHAEATGADPDHIRRDELNVIGGRPGQGFRDYAPLSRL